MKRRTFTLGFGALFAVPALPSTALGPLPIANLTQHLSRAKLLARCHGSASPAMLGRLMKLDTDTAAHLFDLLQERGIVARGVDGIARAATPLNSHCITTEAVRARNLAHKVARAKCDAREFLKQLSKTAPDTENGDLEASVVQSDDDKQL